jgi:hypothetical protein
MEDLLKYTYLLDAKKLNKALTELWGKYLHILENPNWEDLNEARAILYIIGYVFPEQTAPEAISRRLHLLRDPMDELAFYQVVDSESKELTELRRDPVFKKLEAFYRVVKEFKNKTNKGDWYLDEDLFVEVYNKFSPDENMKIGRFGEFGREDK